MMFISPYVIEPLFNKFEPVTEEGLEADIRVMMEKAGLRFVRTFHQPWPDYIEGEEEGDVEYALLRSEWERSRRCS